MVRAATKPTVQALKSANRPNKISIDNSHDNLLSDFGKAVLADR
jgi:hypothetical protein